MWFLVSIFDKPQTRKIFNMQLWQYTQFWTTDNQLLYMQFLVFNENDYLPGK